MKLFRTNIGRLLGISIVLAATSPAVMAEDHLGRGKRWVRSHPFWISALTQTESLYEVDDYRGAGLNTLLAWDPRRNLFEKSTAVNFPIHYHMHQVVADTEQGYVDHVRGLLEKYPDSCTGLLFWDEPQVPDMERVGKICAMLKKEFPEQLVYSNALPKGAPYASKYGFTENAPEDFYAAYIKKFGKIIQPDVIMVDVYPLRSTRPDEAPRSREYFETIALVRQVGLDQGAPYWIFIQAYDHDGAIRRPSESDLRFQLFAPLTLGFTGISYFTYGPAIGPGLIDSNKNRTPLYYHAARANMEVSNVGQAIRFLDSTGVAFVMGTHEQDGQVIGNPVPPMPTGGPWVWPAVNSRPAELLDVEILNTGKGRDALLGFFKQDNGDTYFMVTNLWHGMGRSAADCKLNVRLTFAPGVRTVTRLSRETGVPEELVVQGGQLDLSLLGGTGELLKVGDAKFPGLD